MIANVLLMICIFFVICNLVSNSSNLILESFFVFFNAFTFLCYVLFPYLILHIVKAITYIDLIHIWLIVTKIFPIEYCYDFY